MSTSCDSQPDLGHSQTSSGGGPLAKRGTSADVVTHMAKKYSTWELAGVVDLEQVVSDGKEDEDADAPQLKSQVSDGSTAITKATSVLSGATSTAPLLSATEEIQQLKDTRQLAAHMFDEHFDASGEGDIDANEFQEGIRKLAVELSAVECRQLFTHILEMDDDADDDDYVNKQMFSDFLTQSFSAPKLRRLQEAVLSRFVEHRMDKSAHTLIHAEEASGWNPAEVDLVHLEMMQAMESMVDSEMKKVKETQEWELELERRAAEADFALAEKAADWNAYEVAFFFQSKGHMEAAARMFKEGIDGSMLLNDLTQAALVELGVRVLHAPKVVREIKMLKKSTVKLSIENDLCVNRILSDSSKSDALRAEASGLQQALEEERKQSDECKAQLQSAMGGLRTDLEQTKDALERESNEREKAQCEVADLREKHENLSELYRGKVEEMTELSQSHSAKIMAMIEERDAASKERERSRAEEMSNMRETLRESIEARVRIDLEKEFKEQMETEREAWQASVPRAHSPSPSPIPSIREQLDIIPSDDYFKERRTAKVAPLRIRVDSMGGSSALGGLVSQLKDRKEEDEEFAKSENVYDWDRDEVAYWLISIRCHSYLAAFMEMAVDGAMLMNDLDDDTMHTELGIKRIHCSKMTREIKKLRAIAIFGCMELALSDFINEQKVAKFEDPKVVLLKKEMSELEEELCELKTQLKKMCSELESARTAAAEATEHTRGRSSTSSSRAARIPLKGGRYDFGDGGGEDSEQRILSDMLHSFERYCRLIARPMAADGWNDKFSKQKVDSGERVWKPTPNLTSSTPLPPMPAHSSLTEDWKQFVFAITSRYHELSVICDKQRFVIKKSMTQLLAHSKKIEELTVLIERQKEEYLKLDKKYIRVKFKYRKMSEQIKAMESFVGGSRGHMSPGGSLVDGRSGGYGHATHVSQGSMLSSTSSLPPVPIVSSSSQRAFAPAHAYGYSVGSSQMAGSSGGGSIGRFPAPLTHTTSMGALATRPMAATYVLRSPAPVMGTRSPAPVMSTRSPAARSPYVSYGTPSHALSPSVRSSRSAASGGHEHESDSIVDKLWSYVPGFSEETPK